MQVINQKVHPSSNWNLLTLDLRYLPGAPNLPSIDKPGYASIYIPVRPLQSVAHYLHIPTCPCNKYYHSLLLPYLSRRQGQTK